MNRAKYHFAGQAPATPPAWRIFIVLLIALFSKQASAADGIPKFEGKPVEIIDKFASDSRANYKVAGGAEWSTLKLALPTNSEVTLLKTLAADFTLDFDIWPKPVGEKELSTSRVSFIISGGHHLVIMINRAKQNNQLMRQAQLLEVHNDDNEPTKQVADDIGRSPVFSMTSDVEQWSVRYKNGVVKLSCNSQPLVTTYTNGFISWCQAIAIGQLAGAAELSRIELHGREAGYTTEQREIYDRTNVMHAAAEKAKDARDFRTAILTERQRIPLLEQAFAPDEAAVALAHEWIGNTAMMMQRWDGAKKEHGLAAEAFVRSVGENHPYIWFSRLLIARDMAELGETDAAEALARPNATAFLRMSSRDPRIKVCEQYFRRILSLVACRKLDQSDYAAYLRYRKEMAEICATVHGPKDVETKRVQYDLANAQRIIDAPPSTQKQIAEIVRCDLQLLELAFQGDYKAGERLMLDHLADCRKYMGDAPLTADWHRHLGIEAMNLGNFGAALQYIEELVAIRKRIGGENDSDFAAAEADLASIYSQLGRYADAVPRFDHALKTIVANNDTHSEGYAYALLEYGRHLMRVEKWDEAETPITNCIKTYQEIGLESNANALKARERLADLYRRKRQFEKVDQLLAEQKRLSRGNTDAGAKFNILLQEANGLWWKGKLDEAEKKYQEAIDVTVEAFGKRGRGYEAAIGSLMELYAYKRDYKNASKAFGELLEFNRLKRESLFEVYTPFQQFEQSASDRLWLNRLMLLTSHHLINDDDAYEHLLEIKGAVTLHQRRTQLASSRPELKDLVKRRQENGSKMAAIYAHSISDSDLPNIERLATERLAIEKEMSSRSAAYRTAAEKVTVQRIRELRPPNVAIIDYVEYEAPPNFLERLFTSDSQPQLAAFVMTKQGGPKFFDLGPAARVDKAVLNWARAIVKEKRNLIAEFDPQLEQDTDRAGAAVRQLIWDPVKEQVKTADSIVISPDGVLVGCPFPAIPLNEKPEYLVESKALSQIAAVGLLPDLLSRKTPSAAARMLFVSDVDYNLDLSEGKSTTNVALTSDRVPFRKVPASHKKVEQLYKQTFPAGNLQELLAANTTEANVRQAIPGASVIYLYTHGFCVPLSEVRSASKPDALPVQPRYDPLIAGIALAGANRGILGNNDAADGILWASEIAMLNLERTELVTLLACETAFGNSIPGEGMQGSQRALTVAGAKSSLTSIWSVIGKLGDDNVAENFTDRFYENLWTKRLSKAESLRESMRFMLRQFDWSEGRKLNATHRCPPYLWSNWVLSGDWR
jgi:CHAT domain-containing protein